MDPHRCALPAFVVLTSLLWSVSPVAAQSDPTGRTLRAVRATGAVVIDGRLDEPDWERADVATDFVQNDPHEGAPASERTEVRILHDDETLYVGAFAHHRHREDVVVNEMKRDFDGASTDWMAIILDTFHDRRNGYQFGVNPAGAMWDSQKSNEGRERNLNWDGAWTVRTRQAPDGWYAEFAIPFRTLQIPRSGSQTWGINFQRHLQRRLENSFWAPIPRQYALDRLSRAGTLEGLEDVERGVNLRVKPYALARTLPTGATGASRHIDVGGDLKYGITPNLTTDLTLNTDFSQVEADIQQVGATRFSVRFPEKREFFLENSGAFQFGPGTDRSMMISAAPGTSAGGRDNSVQNDLIPFFSRRIGLSDSGTVLPLEIGARLTGRIGRSSLGVLHIRQGSTPSAPAAAFTAVRVRRNLGASSDVGAIVLDQQGGAADNRVVGIDVNARPAGDLLVYGYAAKTLEGRRSTDGRATAARAGATWMDRSWVADASWGFIGAGFDDRLGFVPRNGVERGQALVGRHFRPRTMSRWVRDVYMGGGVTDVRREHGGFDSRYGDYRALVTFQDGATLELGANHNDEDLRVPFAVSSRPGAVVPTGRYAFTDRFVAAATSRSKPLALEGRLSEGRYYSGRRHLAQLSGSARLNAHLNGSVAITRDRVELPTASSSTYYLTARGNVGVSTRLFVNALVQYNSDARRWDTNVRFNWIHHPLSDLFVVYTDGRERDTVNGHRSTRALTVKVTRLINF